MRPGTLPQKLRYALQYCSGEDPDYPARELLYHSPHTRGWQSPRFCKYPQEVVIRLEGPAQIQQIQVLSHEYKIATKMDIHVGTPVPSEGGAERVEWKRLGYLSFDSNERSGYLARELKSVHVTSRGSLLQFSAHRCHINKLNIYNQVGVIALNVVGEVLPSCNSPPGLLELHQPPRPEPLVSGQAAAAMADLTLDVNVDPITAAKIRDIARQKDQAVAQEDYDAAKRLKGAIERLKALGQKIAALEARKRTAVDREDYDTAKLLKADIDKLRGAGEAAAMGPIVAKGKRTDPEEIFSRALGKKGSGMRRLPSEAGTGGEGLGNRQASEVDSLGAIGKDSPTGAPYHPVGVWLRCQVSNMCSAIGDR
eukprot:evm.model.scf_816.1 EVM.evm.TU.scf_816.1   scf_816:1247-3376(-)